jgi:hypothetical protein
MNPMINPWKLATIVLLLIGVTALSTGLTTAYFMRPAPAAATVGDQPLPAPVTVSPAPVTRALHVTPAARRPVAATPRVVRTAAAPVADGCASTGDRVWRIAKPGAIGALIGAGVGAAGGAIADGGGAAGKGALIGGLAGAVLGGGYGAYKTKNECGTVLGGTSSPLFATAR